MNICRICLSNEVSKSLHQVEIADKSGHKSYVDILMFCFGIQVSELSSVTKGLCMKCYRKIISYYKFKTLALTSDTYLKSLEPQITIKNEIFVVEEDDGEEFNNNDFDNSNVKDEVEIKCEEDNLNFDSDDNEFLSVIKKVKEDLPEESKENIKKGPRKSGTKRAKATNGPRTERIRKSKKLYPKTRTGVCEECGKYVRNLLEHAKTHIAKHDRVRYQCKLCDKEFISKGSRYKHVKFKHKGFRKHCDVCNKDVVCLRSHKLRIHNPELMAYPCLLCNQRFIGQSQLDLHMMLHTKDRPYECDLCKKKFRIKDQLLRHIRSVHERERHHVCQYCPKSFFKKYNLQEHLRTHTKEKPYECNKCGAKFATSTTLKNHQTVHSDDKPHQCPYCDLAFARNTYLRVHLITHTKEKRHSCKYCGILFGRSDHRNRHEYTAHEKFSQGGEIGVTRKKRTGVIAVPGDIGVPDVNGEETNEDSNVSAEKS